LAKNTKTYGFRAYLIVIARFDGTIWSAMGCIKQEHKKLREREKNVIFLA